jgi:alpha-glucosidase
MRALAWEFPNEPELAGVDTQFLLGGNILITPVLEPQVDSVKGVFPGVADGQVWYDWYTGEKVAAQAGVNTSISAPLGHIPVFVRGRSVLPLQEPGYTTTESRNNPWGLIVALGEAGDAYGSLYIDDGESLEPLETLNIEFSAQNGTLRAEVKGNYVDNNALGNVTVMGVFAGVGSVRFNNQTIDNDKVQYSQETGVLVMMGLNDLTIEGTWKNSWTLSWS